MSQERLIQFAIALAFFLVVMIAYVLGYKVLANLIVSIYFFTLPIHRKQTNMIFSLIMGFLFLGLGIRDFLN